MINRFGKVQLNFESAIVSDGLKLFERISQLLIRLWLAPFNQLTHRLQAFLLRLSLSRWCDHASNGIVF